MSRVRDRNTKPEMLLRRALWSAGLRYRIGYPLTGKPDLVFVGPRVAVFLDGCFWHRCPLHATYPKKNRDFWEEKLSGNVRRDTEVNARLAALGWTVLRFWEHEVEQALPTVIARISSVVGKASQEAGGADPVANDTDGRIPVK